MLSRVDAQIQTIVGTSQMAEAMRLHNWAQHPLGPIAEWPLELLSAVNLMLSCPFPVALHCGAEFIMLYNDGYRETCGERHPASLGSPFRETWQDAWETFEPKLLATFTRGEVIQGDAFFLPIKIHGVLVDRYWTFTLSPLYVGGKVAGVFNTCQDVTHAVEVERDLHASEVRASQVLESIGDAVIVTDAELRIVQLNPLASKLTGWNKHEAAGQPADTVFQLIDEHTREKSKMTPDVVLDAAMHARAERHTLLVGKDGRETSVDESYGPIRDDAGNPLGFVLVFRDISERRALERERDVTQEKLQQVYDAMTDAVAILDFNWTVVFLNAKARAEVAASGEVLGRNHWECFPAMVFDGSPWVENYTRTMNERVETEFEHYYAEPLNHWVHMVARPCREGIIVFFRDVTQQRLAAKALLQNEKLAAVGRLASSIAHEINNPLESVTNLIYLARGSEDLSEAQQYLETAERELRRVGAISNQTLRFHRQSSKPVSVSCLEIIESSMSIYQGRLVNSNVTVERRKRAEYPVICFEGEIRQVLHNLIGNSIDAMPPEGGRLLLRSREATDWASGRRGLVLTVADTAGGMSQETLARIFEPFYTTKGHAGTGLGLWISQDIVARHNGVLRVRSSQRVGGTVCTLFLPFEAAVR